MIQRLLRLSHLPEPEDAADALALALCHGHTLNITKALEGLISI
jgi:crossover junction endodeoxyribonuclease RuvC